MSRISKRRRGGPLAREAQIAGWLFISPMVLGFTLLLLFPMGLAFYMSLTDWPLLGDHEFIGLDNYRNIMTDAMFWDVLGNTVYFTAGLVPLNIVLALLLALLLSKSIRGIGIFRIVWKLMYATESGLINQLLLMIGIKGPAWLYDPNLAMPAVIVTSVLKNVGLNMVLFIAALQQVPRSLYEAATLDGAGKRASFFNVTLPMITPTVFLTVVMTVIGSLKVFGQIYVMTQGGPSNSTKVLVYYIWEKAFKLFQFGYASSLAYVLFVIVLILTLLQWQLRKRWVFGEGDA